MQKAFYHVSKRVHLKRPLIKAFKLWAFCSICMYLNFGPAAVRERWFIAQLSVTLASLSALQVELCSPRGRSSRLG